MIYVFDIDGVVADPSHRLHHIQGDEKDWNAFYEACDQDPPQRHGFELCLDLVLRRDSIQADEVLFLTGRPEKVRAKTEAWLTAHELLWEPACLFMRPDDDHSPATEFKPSMIRSMSEFVQEDGFLMPEEVEFTFIEDNPKMIQRWRKLGHICLDPGTWKE